MQAAPVTEFGRSLLSEWRLDSDASYLNHGTVGAPPRRVLAAQQAIRDEIERQPVAFPAARARRARSASRRRPTPRMRRAAATVAGFLGARGEDLVFVDNITTGMNAVLRSLDLAPGRRDPGRPITCYGAVTNAARYVARRRRRARAHGRAAVPGARPGGVHLDAIVAARSARARASLIVEHITSRARWCCRWRRSRRAAARAACAVLADGAHAPGAIALDIPSLGVDWYPANLHKWAWAPRSCGILWARPERQPAAPSAGDLVGARPGLHGRVRLGGDARPLAVARGARRSRCCATSDSIACVRYNHALALEAGRRLGDGVGGERLAPDEMIGTMITLRLPHRLRHDGARGANGCATRCVRRADRSPALARQDRLWLRVSAQIYNDESDIDRLARALVARRGR